MHCLWEPQANTPFLEDLDISLVRWRGRFEAGVDKFLWWPHPISKEDCAKNAACAAECLFDCLVFCLPEKGKKATRFDQHFWITWCAV